MSDDTQEVILRGGNSFTDVVRISDTVRRMPRPWSASVDALLSHLEWIGYDGAPRALGYDDRGRQVLSYVSGHVDADPRELRTSQIADVGRLIREYHDAVSSFVPPVGSIWNVAIVPDREDLICHHDLAPWNLVRGPSSLVFIDWDGAGPGSRLWDLSYAVHGFAPLSPTAHVNDDEVAERLGALVNGYGLEAKDRQAFVDMLVPRIRSMYSLLKHGNETNTEPWRTLWSEGHGDTWLEDAIFAERRLGMWTAALL